MEERGSKDRTTGRIQETFSANVLINSNEAALLTLKCKPQLSVVDSSVVDLSIRERWALDYFLKRVPLNMYGYSYEDLWYIYLPEICVWMPSVRHGVIALGAAYLQEEFRNDGFADKREELDTFVVRRVR